MNDDVIDELRAILAGGDPSPDQLSRLLEISRDYRHDPEVMDLLKRIVFGDGAKSSVAALQRLWDASTRWTFWLPDDDRSTGWTNHGYVLQFVCEGFGATYAEAWEEAKANGRVPDGFHLPDQMKVMRGDADDLDEATFG